MRSIVPIELYRFLQRFLKLLCVLYVRVVMGEVMSEMDFYNTCVKAPGCCIRSESSFC